ncbi:probable trehalose-phosphate phosphatase C isoform X3 [Cryptomeria japonica]|uniref:probable trehalose-phosphate phosphatase C isoform X3 n=1 Tax=Cryptomeria japonica TaxID=3369 RepID=UPI0027D9DF30|nr:probable trehalose-phosphate phosphatase C isoform X3 [Cryptomeria japonica]XP_059072798.1 probable trehalose-phosphate phosphatase C isoform X3 [Cryptomeria japonica]
MATRSKHKRVLTDSAILIPNWGSLSFPMSPSGSPLFSCASPFKCSGSSAQFSCSSPRNPMPLKNSDEQVEEWLEAMRSSSPPQVNYLDTQKPVAGNVLNNEWLVKHPSALDVFEDITSMAQGKQLVVFLDYDGTLSPIVENPDHAYMSDEMRNALRNVAKQFPTAIITGRCRDKVFEFVQLPELYYAGSHGMDIMGPTEIHNSNKEGDNIYEEIKIRGKAVSFQPASEYLPLMDEVCRVLKERARYYTGARVEHNKYCITVHFRCVKEEIWGDLAEEVRSVLYAYPGLSMTQGRKVLELRPSIEWDKGRALEFLLNALGLENAENVVPLYIGDDRTDEDAFNVLKNKGYGCGIIVSAFAKETSALYSLRNPSEVMEFLKRLVRWKLEVVGGLSACTCTDQVEG